MAVRLSVSCACDVGACPMEVGPIWWSAAAPGALHGVSSGGYVVCCVVRGVRCCAMPGRALGGALSVRAALSSFDGALGIECAVLVWWVFLWGGW